MSAHLEVNMEPLQKPNIVIDNIVFRLHYKVTMPILVVLGIYLACLQSFKRPIDCTPIDNVPIEFLNNYCYLHATYGIEEYWANVIDERIDFPDDSKLHSEKSTTNYTYYQWVPLVLILQSVLCYIPRYFWKKTESERVAEMVELFKRNAEPELLMNTIFASPSKNKRFFLWYSAAEVSNAIFDSLHIFVMDAFIGRGYCLFGLQVLQYSLFGGSDDANPTSLIFPKMAMCTYLSRVVTDSTEPWDTTCLLPMNVVNEKVYLFLWFWFVLLGLLSCLAVVYRAAIYASSRLRRLELSSRLVANERLEIALENCKAGDWFLIYLLSKNISSVCFRDFIERLDSVNVYA